jgi:Mut7-C ubiquitin
MHKRGLLYWKVRKSSRRGIQHMPERSIKSIEVRAFGRISGLMDNKSRAVPFILDLREPITGTALADKLEIPREEIEVIIVNGTTESLSYSIQPGDRVAFVPWGTPGPYRIFLGFLNKNKR